jgi:NAD(P)-dependent dehydrogenase (short-subunit alcohol dehydrogenase family)
VREEKIVVITGGAGLLGRQMCAAVAESSGIAVVADRDRGAAERVAREIAAKYPDRAQAEQLDITDKSSVLALVHRLHQQHGRIDAVVNNAYPRNANYGRQLADVTYEDFCDNVGMHLGGYFLVAQQFGLFFREQGYGHVLNMASVYGVIAPRFDLYDGTAMTMPVEYAAIKSAIIHLTRYLAQYFKSDGVRVNCISPGGIADNQPDSFLQRYNAECGRQGMLSPTDISGVVTFLLTDAARAINGQNIIVDDGFTL